MDLSELFTNSLLARFINSHIPDQVHCLHFDADHNSLPYKKATEAGTDPFFLLDKIMVFCVMRGPFIIQLSGTVKKTAQNSR